MSGIEPLPPGKYAQGDDEISPDDTARRSARRIPWRGLLRALRWTFVGRSGILVRGLVGSRASHDHLHCDARRRRERRKRIRTWSGGRGDQCIANCAEIFFDSAVPPMSFIAPNARTRRRASGMTLRARRFGKAHRVGKPRAPPDAPPRRGSRRGHRICLRSQCRRSGPHPGDRPCHQRGADPIDGTGGLKRSTMFLVTTRPACVLSPFSVRTCISTLIRSRGLACGDHFGA